MIPDDFIAFRKFPVISNKPVLIISVIRRFAVAFLWGPKESIKKLPVPRGVLHQGKSERINIVALAGPRNHHSDDSRNDTNPDRSCHDSLK